MLLPTRGGNGGLGREEDDGTLFRTSLARTVWVLVLTRMGTVSLGDSSRGGELDVPDAPVSSVCLKGGGMKRPS